MKGNLCRFHIRNPLDQLLFEKDSAEEKKKSDDSSTESEAENEVEADHKTQLENLNTDLKVVGLSPMKFCITKKKFSETSKNTQKQMVKKFNLYIEEKKNQFAQTVCPQDPKGLLDAVEEVGSFQGSLSLGQVQELYESAAPGRGKFAVLTIAAQTFKSDAIVAALKCSKRQVKKAKKCAKELGICAEPEKKSIKRNRMSKSKVMHFLDYLVANKLLQTAAYGVSLLRFQNGEKVKTPKPILAAIRKDLCSSYINFCNSRNIPHLGQSSLYVLLNSLKPASCKQISGLDNFFVGMEKAYKSLEWIVKQLNVPDQGTIISSLRKNQTYLKVNHSLRCSENSDVLSHCTNCALSDPKASCFSTLCKEKHTQKCADCDSIVNNLNLVRQLIHEFDGSEEEKADFIHDFEAAKIKILAYMGHNIRAVQQNLSRKNAFELLENEETAMLLSDWSEKFIPLRCHEGQRNYFGKKGLSIHVHVFFFKRGGKLQKAVYLTIVENCSQNITDTLCVLDVVMEQFKRDNPQIKFLLLRSDNAACYAANSAVQASSFVVETHGLKVLRYDFSESQKGKDQADRESAYFKSIVAGYIQEGHDVLTCEDLRAGILHNGGPKCTKVAVIAVHPGNSILNKITVKGISQLHSFQFEKDYLKVWRYYEVGVGRNETNQKCEFFPKYDVIAPFNSEVRQGELGERAQQTTLNAQFFCKEFSCNAVFDTEEEREIHEINGEHDLMEIQSPIDQFKAGWHLAACLDIDANRPSTFLPCSSQSSANNAAVAFFSPGWALPIRQHGILDPKAKQFVIEKFVEGEKSGRKLSETQLEQMIRSARDPITKIKVFSPHQYLSETQIKSLLSSCSRIISKEKSVPNVVDIDQELLNPVIFKLYQFYFLYF